jgi:hypothetical protein
MSKPYLEVTYRSGKALAAYFYLPRRPEDCSARTQKAEPGLLVDYAADGRAIGVEIAAPSKVTLESFNRVLAAARQPAAEAADLAPLARAG